MNLFIFIVISISLTNIIVRESIFEWFRNIFNKWFPYSIVTKIVNCEACMGFWIGIILCFLYPIGLHWFICGLISSIMNKTYQLILLKF